MSNSDDSPLIILKIGLLVIIFNIIAVILFVVFFFVFIAQVSPLTILGFNNISGSGLPLASLFASNGAVATTLMAAILITIIAVIIMIIKKPK